MSIVSVAEEYFSKLNSMAARMFVDMNETKLVYEDLWRTLPQEEQKQILSESIIKPEIAIKYKPIIENDNPIKYAVKVVIDDNCTYQDEHSGPFSFKSKSQRDLSIFGKESAPTVLVKQQKIVHQPKKIVISNDLYESHEDDLVDKEVDESSGNSLPKTGLDFLDNW